MKAIILAAGYATRLHPLTLDRPKPLLPVGGRSILDHLFSSLERLSRVDGVYLVTNAKFYEAFRDWARARTSALECTVLSDGTCGNENRLGAIGDIGFAIRQARLDEDALILAGDNLFDFDLANFLSFFEEKGTSVACFDLGSLEDASRFGVLELDRQGRVRNFLEKPAHPKSSLISTGLYGYTRSDLARIGPYLNGGGNPDAPGHFLAWLSERKPVFGFVIGGRWFDIGDLASYEEANRIYQERRSKETKIHE